MKINPLIKGIKSLETRSITGELAFLCLNGKSENHLRDLIAFNIASSKPKWTIEREKNHIDLILRNTLDSELNIEFKVGYAGGVISQKENSQVLSSALDDVIKRDVEIVNCIGIMDFSPEGEINLDKYRNSSVIKRTINDESALKKSKLIIKDVWNESKCRFTSVDFGVWDNIRVKMLFCTIQHA